MSLPVFFIVLASSALVAALAALFVSLRAAFGGTQAEPLAAGPGLPDRAALEDEKNALLRALKDLEYEHEVGKIADADYERLERAYRTRAKQVLADLDRDLSPYLSQAEALIARSLGAPKERAEATAKAGAKKAKKKGRAEVLPTEEVARTEAPPEEAAAIETPESEEPEKGEPLEEPAKEADVEAPKTIEPRVCAKCATKNDADASFCKRCASPLGGSDAEAAP